ncbi:hypothetical protein [Terrarubrum flagellatum]|uniref:hypothetical protein n=1 Tax=Terrirubrum flagellatum TaxID=2895980 RepID=UPI003144D82D
MHTLSKKSLQDASSGSSLSSAEIAAQRFHSLDQIDAVDMLASVSASLARIAKEIIDLDGLGVEHDRLHAELVEITVDIQSFVTEHVESAERESEKLWRAPPLHLIDNRLAENQDRILSRWFSGGETKINGLFSWHCGNERLFVSPSSNWMFTRGEVRRVGQGLLRLAAFYKREPLPVVADRYGRWLGLIDSDEATR